MASEKYTTESNLGEVLYAQLMRTITEKNVEILRLEDQLRALKQSGRRTGTRSRPSPEATAHELSFLEMCAFEGNRDAPREVAPIDCDCLTDVHADGTADVDDTWILKQLYVRPSEPQEVIVPFEFKPQDGQSYSFSINGRPGSATIRTPEDVDQSIIETVTVVPGEHWTLRREGTVRLRLCVRDNGGRKVYCLSKAFLYAASGTNVQINLPVSAEIVSAQVRLPDRDSVNPRRSSVQLQALNWTTEVGLRHVIRYACSSAEIRAARDRYLRFNLNGPTPLVNVRFHMPDDGTFNNFVDMDHGRIMECAGAECVW